MNLPTHVRKGRRVRVKSLSQILATLDETGTRRGVPFMEEMQAFCGREMTIAAVAHKTCDTIGKSGVRAVNDCVHLEDARCDGGAHGDCQAACLLFWHTDWIEPAAAAPPDAPGLSASHAPARACHPSILSDDPRRYQCQATTLLDYSDPVATRTARWRLYWLDLRLGNVRLGEWTYWLLMQAWRRLIDTGIAWSLTAGTYNRLQRRAGRPPWPMPRGRVPDGVKTPRADLDLCVGDTVVVRPMDEIMETLDNKQRNRGMWYDIEMAPFSGEVRTVSRRVQRIVNEATGEMIEMKTPCLMLEGVQCRSQFSDKGRLFCPRAIPSYWREIWLERSD